MDGLPLVYLPKAPTLLDLISRESGSGLEAGLLGLVSDRLEARLEARLRARYGALVGLGRPRLDLEFDAGWQALARGL